MPAVQRGDHTVAAPSTAGSGGGGRRGGGGEMVELNEKLNKKQKENDKNAGFSINVLFYFLGLTGGHKLEVKWLRWSRHIEWKKKLLKNKSHFRLNVTQNRCSCVNPADQTRQAT